MKVVISAAAQDDLSGISEYIARFNPDAAYRVIDAVFATFSHIGEYPEIGRLRRSTNPLLAGIRCFAVEHFPNYTIFYRLADSNVQIVRVLHGARDLRSLIDIE